MNFDCGSAALCPLWLKFLILAPLFGGAIHESPLPAEDLQTLSTLNANPTTSLCINENYFL
jgi:hypothetical protein